MRGFCIGFIALLILAPLAAGAQSAPPPRAAEDNRGQRDDRAMPVQKPRGSAESLRQQAREQTVLRAFFERPEVPCFALNGLFKLGAGRVEFVFSFAQSAANGASGPLGSMEFVRFVNFSDKRCAVVIHIFKEVLRDGQRVRLGPLELLSHDEWPPARADIDVFDFPADRIYMSGHGFPNDPEPSCILREGLFAITPSGLQLVFREPRHALPFDVDQYLLRDRRRVAIEFTTATCRLVLEVEKYVGETRLAPLE
jgi:hypothetical protein